jgi:hypothetical protein
MVNGIHVHYCTPRGAHCVRYMNLGGENEFDNFLTRLRRPAGIENDHDNEIGCVYLDPDSHHWTWAYDPDNDVEKDNSWRNKND